MKGISREGRPQKKIRGVEVRNGGLPSQQGQLQIGWLGDVIFLWSPLKDYSVNFSDLYSFPLYIVIKSRKHLKLFCLNIWNIIYSWNRLLHTCFLCANVSEINLQTATFLMAFGI